MTVQEVQEVQRAAAEVEAATENAPHICQHAEANGFHVLRERASLLRRASGRETE